jgi:hypothetical protein
MSDYNLHTIRELLGEAFSSGEITTLAFDLFHDVYQNFSASMTRADKIQMVVEKAQASGKIPQLLAYVQEKNPYQYGRYANQLISQSVAQETTLSIPKPPERSLRQLKREKELLESHAELLTEKVRRLREAVAIETDVTRKFQIEHQLKQAEKELSDIDAQLDYNDLLIRQHNVTS